MSEVSDLLRNDILTGEFPPGGRLMELHLAERYGVGRAAIRAAMLDKLVASALRGLQIR